MKLINEEFRSFQAAIVVDQSGAEEGDDSRNKQVTIKVMKVLLN